MNQGLPELYFIFEAVLVSLVSSLALAWAAIRAAGWMRLIDIPGSAPHKQHLRPTPLAGGLALMAGVLICSLWLGSFKVHSIQVTFLAALPIFFFGVLDDYRSLRPSVKLAAQLVSVALLVANGVHVKIFESPQFLLHTHPQLALLLDWLITALWIVGITNAFNFVDSMDGLLVGLGGVASTFFIMLTLNSNQPMLSQHSAVLLGLCLGLYMYNSPPALLFLGDSGAQTLGFFLGVLAIAYQPQVAFQASSWFVPILLLGVPIFDATLIVFSRLRRGAPVYEAAMDHTYHRLLCLVASPNRAVLIMHLAAIIAGCLAFLGLNQTPALANLVFLASLVCGLLALLLLERVSPVGKSHG